MSKPTATNHPVAYSVKTPAELLNVIKSDILCGEYTLRSFLDGQITTLVGHCFTEVAETLGIGNRSWSIGYTCNVDYLRVMVNRVISNSGVDQAKIIASNNIHNIPDLCPSLQFVIVLPEQKELVLCFGDVGTWESERDVLCKCGVVTLYDIRNEVRKQYRED